MHRKRLLTLVAGLLAVGTAPLIEVPAAHAATTQHVVTTTADVVDPGDGVLSLREAFSLAGTDAGESEIVLQAGSTYHLTICDPAVPEHANADGDLDLPASSPGAVITGNGATIDQDCADERVVLTEQPITMRNVTLTGGDVRALSGGERSGAGVYAYLDITLEDSVITGNQANRHTAVFGGGDISLLRSAITDNTAASGSPGLATAGADSQVTVVDSTMSGNTGPFVGAIQAHHDVLIRNSTISGNTTTQNHFQSAVIFGNTKVTLDHATLVGNTLHDGQAVYAPNIEVRASVLANASFPECTASTGTVTSFGGNVVQDTTCGAAQPSDQTGVADPELGPLADNGGPTPTMLPIGDSPAIDAIPATDCSATVLTDQRGLPRPSISGCDAGAVELQVRPDAVIRRGTGPFVGDGTHNETAAGQTRWVRLPRGGTARFAVRLDNDGDLADGLVVRANRGRGQLTARYFVVGVDVTTEVVAGRTIQLPAGSSAVLGIRVRVGNAAPHSLVRSFTATVRSSLSPVPVDRVRATVRVA